eukprot:361596-Chlamydomonas_euryale.AAC.2
MLVRAHARALRFRCCVCDSWGVGTPRAMCTGCGDHTLAGQWPGHRPACCMRSQGTMARTQIRLLHALADAKLASRWLEAMANER